VAPGGGPDRGTGSGDAVPTRRAWLPVAALLAAFLAWGCVFIARTSFVAGGVRYFCLFDDAMISMTYARNLCGGHGLNWARQGAPVEGFTHPLWLLPMIAVNALAPVPLRDRSLAIQLLALLLLALEVLAVRALVLRHFSCGEARHWLLAAALTAFYYPLDYWSLMGMETGLQALLTTLAVLLALDVVSTGSERHLLLWGVLTCAYLLRMDMLVIVVAVQAFVVEYGGLRRPRQRRRWLLGLAVFCAGAGAYTLFRWLYFHELLPNTYYLKLTGVAPAVRWMRGWTSLRKAAVEHAAVLLPAAAGCATVLRRERRMLLPALVFLACCAYSVYVGGDAWDDDMRLGRFVVFAMPLLFVLLNGALNRILAAWHGRAQEGRRLRRLPAAAETALLGVNLLLWLALADGLVLAPRAALNRREVALAAPPYLVPAHQESVAELIGLRRIAAPDAVVATAVAGIPAFFTDFKMIDLLGYNDRDLARQPSKQTYTLDNYADWRPGHAKWDTSEVLERARPDAVFFTWGISPKRLPRVMHGHGYVEAGRVWVRADSGKIKRPG
jgi:hypothetical protein